MHNEMIVCMYIGCILWLTSLTSCYKLMVFYALDIRRPDSLNLINLDDRCTKEVLRSRGWIEQVKRSLFSIMNFVNVRLGPCRPVFCKLPQLLALSWYIVYVYSFIQRRSQLSNLSQCMNPKRKYIFLNFCYMQYGTIFGIKAQVFE